MITLSLSLLTPETPILAAQVSTKAPHTLPQCQLFFQKSRKQEKGKPISLVFWISGPEELILSSKSMTPLQRFQCTTPDHVGTREAGSHEKKGGSMELDFPSLEDAQSIENVYAIAMQKGGVGKTVATISLAAAAARKGRTTLIVDMDPQGSASLYFKYRLKDSIKEHLYHLLVEGKPIEPIRLGKWISLLPAHNDLAAVQNLFPMLPTTQGRVNMVLARYLAPYARNVDYVIVDCPPSLNLLTKNALGAARRVIVPCSTDEMAEDTLPQILRTVKDVQSDEKNGANSELAVLCVLPTLYSSRSTDSNDVLKDLKETYGKEYLIYPEPVRRLEAYKKAVKESADVALKDPEQGAYWDTFLERMILQHSTVLEG
jgi:chromosome partitioning protein